MGDAINLSARLMQSAADGQVLVDAGVRERAGAAVALESLGTIRVKGKADKPLTEIAVVVPEYHGVVAMDRLNDQDALVIRTDDKGGLSLAVLALP